MKNKIFCVFIITSIFLVSSCEILSAINSEPTVDSIVFSGDSIITMNEGALGYAGITVDPPSILNNNDISYETSNSSVVMLYKTSNTGVVFSARAVGTAVITASLIGKDTKIAINVIPLKELSIMPPMPTK